MSDDFSLSHNETLTELLANDDVVRLNQFVVIARRTVLTGGRFELIETYGGVRHALLATYDTPQAVEAWLSDLNAARSSLGQALLGDEPFQVAVSAIRGIQARDVTLAHKLVLQGADGLPYAWRIRSVEALLGGASVAIHYGPDGYASLNSALGARVEVWRQ